MHWYCNHRFPLVWTIKSWMQRVTSQWRCPSLYFVSGCHPVPTSVSHQHFFHLSRPWPNNTNHWSMTWDVCWQWTIDVCAVCGRQGRQLSGRKCHNSKEQEVNRKATRQTLPDASKLKDMLRGRSTAMRNSFWLRLRWRIDCIRSWCCWTKARASHGCCRHRRKKNRV